MLLCYSMPNVITDRSQVDGYHECCFKRLLVQSITSFPYKGIIVFDIILCDSRLLDAKEFLDGTRGSVGH